MVTMVDFNLSWRMILKWITLMISFSYRDLLDRWGLWHERWEPHKIKSQLLIQPLLISQSSLRELLKILLNLVYVSAECIENINSRFLKLPSLTYTEKIDFVATVDMLGVFSFAKEISFLMIFMRILPDLTILISILEMVLWWIDLLISNIIFFAVNVFLWKVFHWYDLHKITARTLII